MGLFGDKADTALDDGLSAVMLRHTDHDQRALLKAQTPLRAALEAGETVTAIAVDDASGPVIAVTDQRVLVIPQARKANVRVIAPSTIEVVMRKGRDLTFDDVGVGIRISDLTAGEQLATAVNKLILKHRPRTIPKLHPEYFERIFANGSAERTERNMTRLIEHAAFYIGGQGSVYCATLHDSEGFEALVREFGRDDLIDRGPDIADEIIDWIWQWHPFGHPDLPRRVDWWADLVVKPGNLANNGPDIEAWSHGDRRGNEEVWRAAFERLSK